MDFDYFTDNDASKWGTTLYGKPIVSPVEVAEILDCKIVISSTHEMAIHEQLTEMGLSENIVELSELYTMCEQQMSQVVDLTVSDKAESVLVDMYEGIGWGGSELWAANLAYGLQDRGINAILLGGNEQPSLGAEYEKYVARFSEKDTIMQMVSLMENHLPFVFVNNFAGCAFMAAIIVKRKHPDRVKIISVIHNDNKSLFDAHMMLREYIDKVFCVSNQIKLRMQQLYNFPIEQYYFRSQPIPVELCYHKDWNLKNPIRIGYAARLVKQQKRADLLVDMIRYLEKKNVIYEFYIAGEGDCTSALREYILTKKLQNKVHLLGRIAKEKMPEFWKQQDVFVNMSEYEGTSLSMLEAMSYGCVPVTTDVSGANEFIEDKMNGYIRAVGDIKGLANCIEELANDRDKLKLYGTKCRRVIQDRCNPDEYINFWMKNILNL